MVKGYRYGVTFTVKRKRYLAPKKFKTKVAAKRAIKSAITTGRKGKTKLARRYRLIRRPRIVKLRKRR